jgi:hypothetical protein
LFVFFCWKEGMEDKINIYIKILSRIEKKYLFLVYVFVVVF